MKNILQLTVLLFLLGCASIDLPPGGLKDTEPPKIVKSSPDSLETLFTGTEIKITFDEYFTLNNLNQSLIISPPLTSSPKTIVKGKSLIIQPKELLKPNTTYQFYLADGIKDLNEGNPTKNLKLVFSTGSVIDTSFISGVVNGAFSLKPEEGVKVFLYKEYQDSQLLKHTPYYITKTEKSGSFSFTNIANGQYYAYAVLDENNNNRLDYSERVGFALNPLNSNSSNQNLLLSKGPITPNLSLQKTEEPTQGLFRFVFNKSISTNHVEIKTATLFTDLSKDKSVPWHFGMTRDTIIAYLNTQENIDSIRLNIRVDSFSFEETIKRKTKKIIQPSIGVSKTVQPKKSIVLTSNYYIRKTNQDKLSIYDLTDSTTINLDTLLIDQNNVSLYSSWKENHRYQVICQESFHTYYNKKTSLLDTFYVDVVSSDKTGEIEIFCSVDTAIKRDFPFLFVLAKEKKEYERKKFNTDTVFTFSFLETGEYVAYVFQDKNGNGFWDDQNYFKKLPSEPLWRLSEPIEVRTKWKTKGIRFNIR